MNAKYLSNATLSLSSAALVAASLMTPNAGRAQSAPATRAPGSFAAASEATRDLRRTLLESRWNYSKESRASAAEEYAAIKASGEATAADDLIYGIVQYRQHDYGPSEKTLNSALAAMPEDRLTLKTRIWTAIDRDDVATAWPLLSRLQRVVFARAKDPAVSLDSIRDDLVFLGQLHGYLAGPYAELESDRLLLSLRDEVAAGLPLNALSVFEEAERSVESRFDAFSEEFQKLVAEEEKVRLANAEAKATELKARKEDLQIEKSKLDPELNKITDTSRETIGALTEAEALAASSVQTAQRQAEALRIEYFGVVDTLRVLYAARQAREGDNPTDSQRNAAQWAFQDRIGLAWQALNNLEAQMDALQRDHAQLNFNFQQIRQQRAAGEAELQQNVARLAWDAAKIERELQLLERQSKKTVDPNRTGSPQLRQKERSLTSLAAYVDFSLEVPREAALAALKSR